MKSLLAKPCIKFFSLFLIIALFYSCSNAKKEDFVTIGKKPIYISAQEACNIEFFSPRVLKNPGKIYVYGHFLFVIEICEGVHIINNANPQQPQLIKFLKVPGAKDIAIKNNYLYVDNYTDLVVISLLDINNPQLTKRLKNIYSKTEQMYPEADGWFECVDTSRGIIAKWVDVELVNPKCSRGVGRWN